MKNALDKTKFSLRLSVKNSVISVVKGLFHHREHKDYTERRRDSALFNAALPVLLLAILFLPSASRAQPDKAENQSEIVASGGSFTLEKTVTAGGGGAKQSATFIENGTTGQTIAGTRSTGGDFSLYSGFWTPENFVPTSANAVVGGRILTASGAGIRNVPVSITFPTGEIRTTVSSGFGYYRFTEIPVGGTYIIWVSAKKYSFSETSQIRQVQDDALDVDFVADGEN